MTEFYSVNCKKYYEGHLTGYDNNQIIIIADSLEDAQIKLDKCLLTLNYRNSVKADANLRDEVYVPEGEPKLCNGIMIADGFEDSTYHYGIEA